MRIAAPLNSEATPVLQWIEIASSLQIPSFQIIGLPSPEVAEARERVRAAIEASGFEFPRRRIVLNLSPASIRKRGTGLDLAMALAILKAAEGADPTHDEGATLAWGELGLDGMIKPAGQVLRAVYAGWKAGVSRILLSERELREGLRALEWIRQAGELDGAPPSILPAPTLREAWESLRSGLPPAGLASEPDPPPPRAAKSAGLLPLPIGVERAVCVAAAGSHHMLLLGPRGTGKSHATDWLSWLQPPPHPGQSLRLALLEELKVRRAGLDFEENSEWLAADRAPVRRVSSQVRPSALIGSVAPGWIQPGEFSLADGGLLVADEFPEWPRDSREILREPLERGRISLTRSHGTFELPARFTLAANGNLCPCGGWPPEIPLPALGSEDTSAKPPRCHCSVGARLQYLSRLSGPILDRMDLVLLVLSRRRSRKKNAASEQEGRPHLLAERVCRVREELASRWGSPPGLLEAAAVESLIREHPQWNEALDRTSSGSFRARHKICRVALSLAGWDGKPEPSAGHFIEAGAYRPEKLGLRST